MSLRIYSCVSYTPAFGAVRTQDDWTALHFVNAIKGTPLSGYALLPLPSGETVRIDRQSAAAAPLWFAELAVNALPWRDVFPCGLVSVPDANCALPVTRPPRTHCLAEALADALGPDTAAIDLLRWVRPMSKAHSADGSRDPQVLYGRLRLGDRNWPLRGQRVVLVDDVIATGGHLRAAAAFLTDCGAVVTHAICAARAIDTLNAERDPLTPSVHVLPDFSSDRDWLLPEVYDGVEL